jgi:hypothetical protein
MSSYDPKRKRDAPSMIPQPIATAIDTEFHRGRWRRNKECAALLSPGC